jgi:hypothetical protein
MEDLSALSKCDYSYAVSRGGFIFDLDGNARISDFSFLKSIREFNELMLCDTDASNWINELNQSKVKKLIAVSAFRADSNSFPAFVESMKKYHSEIEEIRIEWNETITDLTGLTDLPNLSNVAVSSNMEKAIKSLKGINYRFTLEVDGVRE